MQAFVVLLLFVGIFLVVHSIYEEKLQAVKDDVKVEYRFVPRTYYEEQLSNSDVSGKFQNMFENSSPWAARQHIDSGTKRKNKEGKGDEDEDEDED